MIFFQQLRSQAFKSGTRCSFVIFSPCSRSRHVSVSTSVSAGAGRAGRQELYPAQRQDASPATVTIMPASQAQRWHLPAIEWLQKHLSDWGRARSRHIWQACIDMRSIPLEESFVPADGFRVSALPQDPGVYNPHTRGSHLQGHVQGVTSRARVTLANTDTEITNAIPITGKKAAELSLGSIKKPRTNCPFITLLHILSKCSCLKEKTFYKGFLLSSLSRSFLKACCRNISKGNFLNLLIWLHQALPDRGIICRHCSFFSSAGLAFGNLFNWIYLTELNLHKKFNIFTVYFLQREQMTN